MAQQNRDSLSREAQLLAEDTSIDDLQEFARYLMNKRTLGTYMALVRALPEDFIEFRGNNSNRQQDRPSSSGSTGSRNINSNVHGSNDGFNTPGRVSSSQSSSILQSPAEIASAQQLRDYHASQSQGSGSSSNQSPLQQAQQQQQPAGSSPPRANKFWTKNDLTTMKNELASGKSFAQVASSLGRSPFAVKCKLKEQVNSLGHLNNAEIARAMHMSIRQVEEVKYMRLRRI
ncbi:hypothetical protein MP228_005026 [Amoeboaphelidium protococcarum]|nr:hypothetical protein MP228_005026 [Amoeboaphelidium protococcarum]